MSELSRLSDLNESLHAAETKCHILSSNLGQFSTSPPIVVALPKDEDDALNVLRAENSRLEKDIERNRKVIDSMTEHLK